MANGLYAVNPRDIRGVEQVLYGLPKLNGVVTVFMAVAAIC